MARSSYVYVVMQYDVPQAGFTVKHELVTWLSRQENTSRFDIWRIPDNNSTREVAILHAEIKDGKLCLS